MKHVLVGLMVVALAGAAFAQSGDKRILAARDALRSGDHATLERLAASADDHLLGHYVEYWRLLSHLDRRDTPPPTAALQAFVTLHSGSVPATRLAAHWLRRLAADEDWEGVLRVFPHTEPDVELRCLAWQAHHRLGDAAVLDEVAASWRELLANPVACDAVLEAVATTAHVALDEVWWRFRQQIDSRDPSPAHATLEWLGVGQERALRQLLADPAGYLDRLPDDFHRTRAGRELALAALVRLARRDPPLAHVRLLRRAERFTADEQRHAYLALGYHGALSRLPLTTEWYRAAGEVDMTASQREWRVRAALRAGEWNYVEQAIDGLDATQRSDPEWVYWLARARAERGDRSGAEALYAQIAKGYGYYPMLAAEELGRPFVAPERSAALAPEDKARAALDPDIRRAMRFYALGLPTEGLREWIAALRGRDRGFILGAAHVALDQGLLERAINAAEYADAGDNFELRFLTPYRELVEPQVTRQNLDLAWVYGLMRQESRFNIPARSSAGAQGLMQVMPATGRWVARQIGLKSYHPRMLNDPKTNVLLGTSYLRLILADLDDHPVLASAGYNAGPSRARRWRGDTPIEGAIYVATIPIDETREYVQKVLVNKVVYAALLEGRAQSLKARLGTIPAAVETTANR
ncbi:lytic transglycosylase domain-containing protein [Pseudazoarcus pumilus]|uniref:Transglycosylase n=1 Tax=Pseudazoarcus pumilus TaxID=2067960 RepID=A0A2I6S9J5_9RHOO|nr:lytic transglycosylase domain-containing protein [Pseudazoarcus pumilus]AUN95922.1 transglycosylase [Pseudazoarcus pumilus]